MIFKVAWRNIWRSKVRSFIVIGSIASAQVLGLGKLIEAERLKLVPHATMSMEAKLKQR